MTTAIADQTNAVSAAEQEHLDAIFDAIDVAEEKRQMYRLSHHEVPPGRGLFSAMGRVVMVFASAPIPLCIAAMVAHVEKLARVLIELYSNENFSPDTDTPNDVIWGAWEQVIRAREVSEAYGELPTLETVAELLEQKVGEEQIAKMHGLSVLQVKMERDEPGSVCGPDYVPPIFEKVASDRKAEAIGWSDAIHLSMLRHKIKEMGISR